MNSVALDTSAHSTGTRVALALAAVYLIWGSTYLGIRFALEGGFPPFLLGGVRFIIAGSLMYGFLRWRGVPAPTRAQWGNAAVMGLLLLVLGNGMVNLAEKTVSSGMAAVAVALASVPAVAAASLAEAAAAATAVETPVAGVAVSAVASVLASDLTAIVCVAAAGAATTTAFGLVTSPAACGVWLGSVGVPPAVSSFVLAFAFPSDRLVFTACAGDFLAF